MPTRKTPDTGETPETAPVVHRGEKGRFTREGAKVASEKAAAARREKASRAQAPDLVTLPADQQAVFEAIREAAKKGSPAAVREYRDWLRERGVHGAEQLDYAVTPLEDMTPEQRAFALVLMERHVARAAHRLQGLQRETASGEAGHS